MSSTSSTSETTRCSFCGAELRPIIATSGDEHWVIGYDRCRCERSIEDRCKDADMRAAASKAGIQARYIDATVPERFQLASVVENGRGLYIVGPVGSGKTWTACSVLSVLSADGQTARFCTVADVMEAARGFEPMDRFSDPRFLVIDDMGKEAPTSFALERLFALVDKRYASTRPTIVTTQFEPKELAKRLASNGDIETANAIVSRLFGDSQVVRLTGEDRRLA